MNTTEEIFENVSGEELTEIANMAGLFFTIPEICIAMGWGSDVVDEFESGVQLMDADNPVVSAYFQGRFETEIQLRESLKQSAMNGSNPAQMALLELYRNTKQ